MKHYKEHIGIDISKDKIDVYVYSKKEHKEFKNEVNQFPAFLQWVSKISGTVKGQRLIVFEDTGTYSEELSEYLYEQGEDFAVVPALEIKRSLGIQRGKSDKKDSQLIAEYAYRFEDKIKLTRLPKETLRQLKKLYSQREYYVQLKVSLKNRISSSEGAKSQLSEFEESLVDVDKDTLEFIENKISQIEARIDELISSDEELSSQRQLLMSIPGIGRQVSLILIIYTLGFSKFSTWRQFASYCGIAPFPHTSGSSIKGKSRVNPLANREMKSLLYLAARAALRSDPELIAYYQRKRAEGKAELVVLNAIKNKLVARAFAVIKRGSEYVVFKHGNWK